MSEFINAKTYKSDEKRGNPPDYKGDGIAVWVNQTREGKPYLTIQLFGKDGLRVNAWKYVPREAPSGASPLELCEEAI